jgi:hypothetical protein
MQSFRAAWTIFIELLTTVITLSVQPGSGANIAFPEDNFMGHVCAAKDAYANTWAIITSALNDALYFGNAKVGYMYGAATDVDTNADAMLTITMSTITAFLYQLSLFNLYAMLAGHQIYMCQTNGVLAVMDASGFKLRIQSAGESTAAVAGQCLTVGDATLANYPNENGATIGYKVGSTLQNMFNLLLLRQIDPILHVMDAGIAYGTGVLTSFAEILMAQAKLDFLVFSRATSDALSSVHIPMQPTRAHDPGHRVLRLRRRQPRHPARPRRRDLAGPRLLVQRHPEHARRQQQPDRRVQPVLVRRAPGQGRDRYGRVPPVRQPELPVQPADRPGLRFPRRDPPQRAHQVPRELRGKPMVTRFLHTFKT